MKSSLRTNVLLPIVLINLAILAGAVAYMVVVEDANVALFKSGASVDRVKSELEGGNFKIIVMWSTGIVVMTLWVLYVLNRSAVTPLRVLSQQSEKLRNGDLTARNELTNRSDEIGCLATTFNSMADNLSALVTEVQDSGIKVTTSASDLTSATLEHETTANEQAATAREIVATAREINSTSRKLLETMRDVKEIADSSAQSASNGHDSLEKMQDAMNSMVEASQNIMSKLSVLSEKAAKITNVVTTINKVADQTNLLSLNASIEAEKAGEYGLGFGVVADQIRRLADQTAVATWDIEQMVKEMQASVSTGVMSMESFSEQIREGVNDVHLVSGKLNSVIEQVQTLSPEFLKVHQGMVSQSDGAEQIAQAMGQLSEASQQSAEMIRQTNVTIANFKEAAESLHRGVSRLRV